MTTGKPPTFVPNGKPLTFVPKGSNPSSASSTQRMREFRARHRDYDRKRHALDRARRKGLAALEAKLEVKEAAALTVERAALRADSVAKPLRLPLPETRLCLPAPVIDPALESLNALAMKLAARQSALAVLDRAPKS